MVSHRLDKGGLLLFTLLCGGDYHEGLKGCGPKTALKIVELGFGRSLMEIVADGIGTPSRNFERRLRDWKGDMIQELRTNRRGCFNGSQSALVLQLETTEFPPIQVIKSYVHPVTSWSHGNSPPANAFPNFKVPDLHALRVELQNRLAWSDLDVFKKFNNLVLEGAVLRILYDVS